MHPRLPLDGTNAAEVGPTCSPWAFQWKIFAFPFRTRLGGNRRGELGMNIVTQVGHCLFFFPLLLRLLFDILAFCVHIR